MKDLIKDENNIEVVEIENVEIKEKFKKNKTKEKRCRVIAQLKHFSIIDFDGYGVSINLTSDEYVTVKYLGTIGNADFEIIE